MAISVSCGRRLAPLALLALLLVPSVTSGGIGFRQLTTIHPVAVQRGTARMVKLRSNLTLDNTYAVFFDRPGITMTFAETEPIDAPLKDRAAVGTPFRFEVTVPVEQATGVYELRAATPQAVSSISHLLVTDYPVVEETSDSNDLPNAAQPVALPSAICGVCDRDQDVDCFRFAGRQGQRITAQVYTQRVTECIHIMLVKHPVYHMNPILKLIGPSGQIVAENDNFFGGDSFIHCDLPEDGDYVIQIRDVRFAGSEKFTYCIEVSDGPYLRATFPLAVQTGATVEARPVGFDFEGAPSLTLSSTADQAPGWTTTRYRMSDRATNEAPYLVSPHRQYAVDGGSDSLASATPIELPCGISGRLAAPDAGQYFAFDLKKDSVCVFEIEAHRHGLPLDGILEVTDAAGNKLAEADDTPGSPHAWAWSSKDSRLRFKAPADGTYFVSVRDADGEGGDHYIYYLRAEPDGPDFELFGEYYYAMLAPGSRMLWFAGIKRLNGFDGPVDIEIEGLPPGVHLTPARIPAGMNHCALILSADKDAKVDAALVRVLGKASIVQPNQPPREIVRYGLVTCELQEGGGSAQYRWPCKTQIVGVTKPLDLVSVEARPTEIILVQGGRVEIDVRIVRQEGNSEPVTLAMSHMYYTDSCGDQLPPGVTLSADSRTQLKGDESEAKIILQCAPNALPVRNLPVAVMARVYVTYNISTNYASTPISLTVNEK